MPGLLLNTVVFHLFHFFSEKNAEATIISSQKADSALYCRTFVYR